MRKIKATLFILTLFCFASSCKKAAVNEEGVITDTVPVLILDTNNTQHISVLTQHNDNTRAGLNDQETVLTVDNVNMAKFHRLFTLSVDDEVIAQPLVVGNLPTSFGKKNVVFVATVNNTVYAFDGDNGRKYWQKNYTVNGMRTPIASDMASNWCTPYTNITYNIGIVGTPVIDSATKTMYFVSRSTNGKNFFQYLHAIDITNGNEQANSPMEITATVAGSGDGSVGNVVAFDPLRGNQRQGLALVNGVVYISYASHCDWNPYHGWILGYNAKSLKQQIVYNNTPDGEEGGLWQSGMGIAADEKGNLYVTSGNGTVGKAATYLKTGSGTAETKESPDPTDPIGRSESAVKLTPSGNTLKVASYFTPSNYVTLNLNDLDYGVMGTFLIPNSNYYFTGCKDGNLFLLDRDNMGGFSKTGNNIQQTVPTNGNANMHCQPAYFKGVNTEYVYVWSENDKLRALPFNRSTNKFDNNQMTSNVAGPTNQSGAVLSVSSNAGKEGTGIVWAAFAKTGDAENYSCPGILRAFDANNISKELWNSDQTSGDAPGNYAKFSAPTIANGHVYLASFSRQVVVYGLR